MLQVEAVKVAASAARTTAWSDRQNSEMSRDKDCNDTTQLKSVIKRTPSAKRKQV